MERVGCSVIGRMQNRLVRGGPRRRWKGCPQWWGSGVYSCGLGLRGTTLAIFLLGWLALMRMLMQWGKMGSAGKLC